MSAVDDAIHDTATISRYLLHEASEREQEEIERRYFSDPEYLALLEAVEGDLIDAYVRRELSQAQRLRFEKYFLCTRARRERLRMAEALQRHLPRRVVSFPAGRVLIAVAASLLVLAAIAAWLWTRTAPPAVVHQRNPVHVETPRVPVTVAVTLLPGLTRDPAAPQKIVLGPEVEQVRVSALVEVEGDWRDIRASLRSSDWSASRLPLNADRTVTVTIPATRLTPGEHVLVLTSGGEPLGDYAFVVTRTRSRPL